MDPREYPEKVRKSKASPNAHRATSPKGGPKAVYLADLDEAILDGIRQGKTQLRLSQELGVTASTVSERLHALLHAKRSKNVEEVREICDRRLEIVIESHMDKAIAGEVRSAELIVKATVAKAKLHGAEAPEVRDVRLSTNATPAEARRIMQELFGGNVGPRDGHLDDEGDDTGAGPEAAAQQSGLGGPAGAPPGTPVQ